MAKKRGSQVKSDLKQRRRPVQARSLEKYNRILDAVPRVLAQRGYRGATTEALALEADVSIGTLYEYFADKDDVFSRYLRERVAQVTGEVARRLPAEAARGVGHVLDWLIDTGVDAVLAQRPVVGLLVREVPGLWEAEVVRGIEIRIHQYADALYNLLKVKLDRASFDVMIEMLTQVVVGFYMRLGMAGPGNLAPAQVRRELKYVVRSYVQSRAGERVL